MADLLMVVDTALAEVPVNLMPLLDDTDFKTRETAIVYNSAGMDLVWNFVTTGGAYTQTAVTPTTAGTYDWTHQGDGMYSIEIPASSGASINNDTEGFGWFSGLATGVLPWRGPVIQFSPANVVNALVNGSDLIDVSVTQWRGDAVTVPETAGVPVVDVGYAAGTAWGSGAISAASIAANAITDAKVASDVTIASVTGAVGSVTGAVGSIASGGITTASFAAGAINAAAIASDAITDAKVASDVTIASVTGAVGSVTGNVGGNVVGSVGSVTTVSDKTGYRLSATGVDDVWDEVMEGSFTARQFARGFAAALLGELSGAGTTTIEIRDASDTKVRITATVDANGNRSVVVLDLT